MTQRPYRGRRVDNGEWVYFNCHGAYVDENGNELEPKRFTRDIGYKVDPATVGQYTGLKDKDGQLIFEGDIIKQTYHLERGNVYDGTEESYDGHHIGVVVHGARGVVIKNPLHYSEDNGMTEHTKMRKQVAGYRSEVIGNRWDNPELLEATKP